MPHIRFPAAHGLLRQLGFQLHSGACTLPQYLDAVADLLKAAIACPRVTVWLLQRDHPESTLQCTAWSSFSRGLRINRCALSQEAVQAYLKALLATGVLAVPDLDAALPLQALNAAYCQPEQVLATLDAAFVVNGQAVGVVCCEQIGEVRQWTGEECLLVRSVAQAVTLDMARLADGVQPGDDCSDDVRRLLAALGQ
ncbi:GAF domain-containing protein [Aquincola tertiaricarbonis]|uniref:GAF domain-containing protein n=1 Tax=Aquincola tertiaricarbonis TaxID=391953 RepID=A0ABY4S556_AQUTE|nr:GAF domain-containing protein [Aquincola tertiaricarbonis]URI07569.1 GAF domain-containing protein [Aquincola tertiaricarbonis]